MNTYNKSSKSDGSQIDISEHSSLSQTLGNVIRKGEVPARANNAVTWVGYEKVMPLSPSPDEDAFSIDDLLVLFYEMWPLKETGIKSTILDDELYA